jgi:nitroreductase
MGVIARLEMTSDELLSTARTVRRHLDLARRVDRTVIAECVELAIQAPPGSNRQAWIAVAGFNG